MKELWATSCVPSNSNSSSSKLHMISVGRLPFPVVAVCSLQWVEVSLPCGSRQCRHREQQLLLQFLPVKAARRRIRSSSMTSESNGLLQQDSSAAGCLLLPPHHGLSVFRASCTHAVVIAVEAAAEP